jgi:hypothetical protein
MEIKNRCIEHTRIPNGIKKQLLSNDIRFVYQLLTVSVTDLQNYGMDQICIEKIQTYLSEFGFALAEDTENSSSRRNNTEIINAGVK